MMHDPFRIADPLWVCPACLGLNIHVVRCWGCGADRPLPSVPVARLLTRALTTR